MRNLIFLISTLVIASCTDKEEGNYISFNDKELIPNEKNITSHSIIQPGAPGEDSKTLDPVEATNIASTSYVQADVDFLQGMIVHHQQAILMSELAEERTNNQTILDLADRIDISQEDALHHFHVAPLCSRRDIAILGPHPQNHFGSQPSYFGQCVLQW